MTVPTVTMAISATIRLTLKTILKLLSHDMFGPLKKQALPAAWSATGRVRRSENPHSPIYGSCFLKALNIRSQSNRGRGITSGLISGAVELRYLSPDSAPATIGGTGSS